MECCNGCPDAASDALQIVRFERVVRMSHAYLLPLAACLPIGADLWHATDRRLLAWIKGVSHVYAFGSSQHSSM